jgi:hypothetical protein
LFIGICVALGVIIYTVATYEKSDAKHDLAEAKAHVEQLNAARPGMVDAALVDRVAQTVKSGNLSYSGGVSGESGSFFIDTSLAECGAEFYASSDSAEYGVFTCSIPVDPWDNPFYESRVDLNVTLDWTNDFEVVKCEMFIGFDSVFLGEVSCG